MNRWRDMVLYESAKKCPCCGELETLKRIEDKKNPRQIAFRCDKCKNKMEFKNRWTYFASYAIALLAGELLYLLVLTPNNVNTTLSIIIMLVVLVVVKELFSYLVFAFSGVCRMKVLGK